MEKGDIIIDGGNSGCFGTHIRYICICSLITVLNCLAGHYPDSNRRMDELEKKGLLFVGSGVSGGEEGARYGPSLSKSHSSKTILVASQPRV